MWPMMLANANVRILFAAMTFVALLLALLIPDGCIDPSYTGQDWSPYPVH
jgi:hypothetical protein